MSAALSALGIETKGRNHGVARCPGPLHAHGDRHPSLTWREKPDGTILLKCMSGCETAEVLASVGLSLSDLFPENLSSHGKPDRRPFPCSDVFRAVAFESLVVSLAAIDLSKGLPLTETSKDRLLLAHQRIQGALEAAGLSQ